MAVIRHAQQDKHAIAGVGDITAIEASRGVAAVGFKDQTRAHFNQLLGLDSKLLAKVGSFAKSFAAAGLGVKTVMKSLGKIVGLI